VQQRAFPSELPCPLILFLASALSGDLKLDALTNTTESTTMHLRTLARPTWPQSLLCIAVALAPVAKASLGDRQPEFKSCVAVSLLLLKKDQAA
jgi:hypothetical protein